jgi:Domain of unknown function (DUF4328)
MSYLQPNAGRAKTATILLWASIGAGVLSIISYFLQYQLLSGDLESLTEDIANSNDRRQLLVSVLSILMLIVTAVFFIMWFRRAYNNLHQIGSFHVSFGEGWAAGSWFVPILNLFRPVQIMSEIWKGTQAATPGKPVAGTPLIALWWTFWIIATIVGRIAFRMPDKSVEDVLTATWVQILSEVLQIIAGIALILLIRKVNTAENELYDAWASGMLTPAPTTDSSPETDPAAGLPTP